MSTLPSPLPVLLSLALLPVATGVPTARAAVLQVAPDGSAEYGTIGEALAEAGDGDVVRLAPGTYSAAGNGEVFPLDLPPGVTLEGSGPTETVLDGAYESGLLSADWTEGSPVVIRDLTLTRGEAPADGGGDVLYLWQAEARVEGVVMEANGDPTLPDLPWNMDAWVDFRSSSLELVDVVLTGNHGSYSGVLCDHGSLLLQDAVLVGNYSYYGLIDLTNACEGQLDALVVEDNAGGNCRGALLDLGPAAATNLVLAGNDVGPCRLLRGAELVHATAVDNRTHGVLPLIEVDRLGHSIVAFNDAGVRIGHLGEAAFNDVYANASGDWIHKDRTGIDGNLAADPELVARGLDGSPRDLHLAPGSPLRDAGGDQLTSAVDLEGTERPLDGDGDGTPRPDPGVYEHDWAPADDDDSADDDDDCACRQAAAGRPASHHAVLALGLAAALARRRHHRSP